MKHVNGTYLWIREKGLLFANKCFFEKIFLLRIKNLFVPPDQYFIKRKNIHEKIFQIYALFCPCS